MEAVCISSVHDVRMNSAVAVEVPSRRHRSLFVAGAAIIGLIHTLCYNNIHDVLFLQACGRFQSCAARGLHAHHPRDCLYFMRDFTVEQLQDFLRKNNVEFLTDPSQEQLEAVGEEKKEGGEGAEIEGEGEGGGGGGGGVAEAGDGDVAAAEVKGE